VAAGLLCCTAVVDPTFQLQQDERFQERQWRAARAAPLTLLAIVLLTVLGLFGNGPFSRARAGAPGGPLWVEYSRFARYGASTRVLVHARADAGGTASIFLSRSLVQAFRVTNVTPDPTGVRVTGDGVEYRIAADPGASGLVVVDLVPATRWIVHGSVGSGTRRVDLTQFIYP